MSYLDEQIAIAIRSNEETARFVAEQRSLIAKGLELERHYPFRPGRYVAAGVTIGITLMMAGAIVARLVLI